MDSLELKSKYLNGERDFRGVDLTQTNLLWFDLREADFTGSDFTNANLGGANLSGTNLQNCTLTGADLSRAKLVGTNICGSTLVLANLSDTKLENLQYDDETQFPAHFLPPPLLSNDSASRLTTSGSTPAFRDDSSLDSEPPPMPSKRHKSPQKSKRRRSLLASTAPVTAIESIQEPTIESVETLETLSDYLAQPPPAPAQTPLKVSRAEPEVPPTALQVGPPTSSPQIPSREDVSPSVQLPPHLVTQNHGTQTPMSASLSAALKEWNWGAFLAPTLWCLGHQIWWAAIASVFFWSFGPMGLLITGVIAGLNGNQWAWKSRQWRSLEEFKTHQRYWALGAGVFWIFAMPFVFILLLSGS